MNNPSNAPSEVFISYSSRDADRVIPIVRQLEAVGITVWRDGDRILGGDYYGEEIAEAIAQSKVLLLMCSQSAFGSDNVAQEVRMTWDFSHHNVLPLLLEKNLPIPIGFRYCLAGKQWIEIVGQPVEIWLPILVAALAKKGVHPRTRPAPQRPAADSKPTVVEPPSVKAPPPAAPAAERQPSQPAAAVPAVPAVPSVKEERPSHAVEPESRVQDTTGKSGEGRKGLRFRAGQRPIPGVDLELVEPLGVGGFGEVWKAINPLVPNMRPVALKFCTDPEAQEYLRHEAATVAQVLHHGQRHEGIVSLLHTYLSADPPALEYEFVSGGNLSDQIRSAAPGIGTLPLPAVGKIIRRLAEIVAFAHQADPPIVHRDLKPANILVEFRKEKALLRIADFGIGGVAANRIISQTSSSGKNEQLAAMLQGAHTPLYASPQQIAGKRPDPRDDVHALGVIWYQLLVGDLTCGAPSGRKWTEALRKRGMTSEAIDILNACFESRAEDRPADASVLLQRLTAPERSKPAAGVAATPSSAPYSESLYLDLPAAAPRKQPAGSFPSAGTTSRPSGSRKTDTDHLAYPRFASDGTILLQCECGKILKVPSTSTGQACACPVCGEKNAVPDSLVLSPRQDGDIPEVLPAEPPAPSPLSAVQWNKVFVDRAQDRTPVKERRGLWDRLFGPPGKAGGAAQHSQVRTGPSIVGRVWLTLALVAVALVVLVLIVSFLAGSGGRSVLK